MSILDLKTEECSNIPFSSFEMCYGLFGLKHNHSHL